MVYCQCGDEHRFTSPCIAIDHSKAALLLGTCLLVRSAFVEVSLHVYTLLWFIGKTVFRG